MCSNPYARPCPRRWTTSIRLHCNILGTAGLACGCACSLLPFCLGSGIQQQRALVDLARRVHTLPQVARGSSVQTACSMPSLLPGRCLASIYPAWCQVQDWRCCSTTGPSQVPQGVDSSIRTVAQHAQSADMQRASTPCKTAAGCSPCCGLA